jgi:glycosyltransferase involved in cell wall biosynthesis
MYKPLVSVLMTAYNREKYISEAIESVLNSTYENFELIIVNDYSRDRTLEIARKYSLKDNRIKVYNNERNLGDYQNRNQAASFASGEILMSVDSDDTILKNAIYHIVNLFEKYPQSHFLTLNRDRFFNDETLVSSKELIRRHFLQATNLHYGPGATAIKAAYFKEIGGFPISYGPANDMYYNIKAACYTPVILCKLEFLNYRIHDGQEANNKFSYLYNGYLYYNDILSLPGLPLYENEIKILLLQSKRRFITNTMSFLLKTGNFYKTIKAIKYARFSLIDFRQGLFLR